MWFAPTVANGSLHSPMASVALRSDSLRPPPMIRGPPEPLHSVHAVFFFALVLATIRRRDLHGRHDSLHSSCRPQVPPNGLSHHRNFFPDGLSTIGKKIAPVAPTQTAAGLMRTRRCSSDSRATKSSRASQFFSSRPNTSISESSFLERCPNEPAKPVFSRATADESYSEPIFLEPRHKLAQKRRFLEPRPQFRQIRVFSSHTRYF